MTEAPCEGEKCKILLVEDNPGDARLIREMLSEAGEEIFEIEWVSHLAEALDRLAQGGIDVVLLDLALPDSHGLETFLRAYAQAPRVAFVVLTGLTDQTVAVSAVRQGAQDYLVKGETDSRLLLRAIKYAAERKQAEEALRQAHDNLERRVEERTAELVETNTQLQEEIKRRRYIQGALQESEARYRAIFENTGTATCIVEEDRTISLANAEFERLSGYAREEIEGKKHAGEFIFPEDLEGLRTYLRGRESDPAAAHKTHEFRFKDKNGEIKDILLTVAAIPDTRRTVTSLLEITARKEAEKTLRRQAELLELARDAILVRGKGDRITYWNGGATETYGYAKEAVLGRIAREFLQTEFPKPLAEIEADLQREGRWEGELVHSRADGRRLIVASRWALQRDEQGHPTAILEINRDISDRKRAEQALRLAHDNLELKVAMRTAELARANAELQEEIQQRINAEEALATEQQRLFALLDGLPAFVYLKAPDASIRFANRIFRELFGEPGSRRCYEVIYGKSEPCEVCPSFEVIKTEKPISWELYQPANGYTFQVYDYPFADVDGSPLVLTLGIDITERKRAEEAIKESAEELAAIYNNAPLVMLLVDSERRVRKANKFAEQFAQASAGELSGQPGGNALRCLNSLDDPRGCGFGENCQTCPVRRTVLETLETGRSHQQVEATLPFPGAAGAEEITFLLSTARFSVRDQYQVLVTIQDITKRKQAEKKLMESEKNLRYLATRLLTAQEVERKRVSRELHDELGQSLLTLKLQLGAMEKKFMEGWEVVKDECGFMMTYLNQVVEDVRRLSRDLSPTVLEDLGLSAALRRIIAEFGKHYNIEADIDEIDDLFSPEARINLYRIFQEAFTNIGKYAQADRVTVSLKQHGGVVAVRVADNGRGFDLEQVLSGRAADRGLGLAAMEERVRMLGGTLHIRSAAGQGTEISFTVPVATAAQQYYSAPEEQGQSPIQ